MLIKNVAASLPSRVVTNDEVVDMIRFHSTEYEGDIDRATRTIKTLLDRSGLVNRRWCGTHESPIDHVAMATRKVLSETYLKPEHIELFIFVGIGRGFLEPGNSHMMASTLGFVNAECFDVVDACMSWTRAMSIIDSLFKSGQYRNAMIVNAEFNMLAGGPLYPGNFALKNKAQIEYTLPSFTPPPRCSCRRSPAISALRFARNRKYRICARSQSRATKGFATRRNGSVRMVKCVLHRSVMNCTGTRMS
jgi:hypothetical protein